MMKRYFDFLIGIPLVLFFSFFKGKNRLSQNPVDKILVIKLAAAGDTILLIPLFRNLREAYPELKIHWMVSPINQAIAATVPYIDKLIILPNTRPASLLKIIWNLRKEKYDLVVDLEQWSRGTAVISFMTGTPDRLGFDTPGQHRSALFTESVEKMGSQHEIFNFFDVFSLRFNLIKELALELWETESGRAQWNQIQSEFNLNSEKTLKRPLRVLFHPGCGADGRPREWPLANYAVLGHWLKKNLNAEIFLSSGPEEKLKTAQLNSLLQNKAVDLGGKLGWEGTISMVRDMDLVVSGNTGIMHVAAALKKPQVALHGPTNPKLWGPLNPNARIIQSSCPKCPCLNLGFEYHSKNQSCMAKIEIETVKKAIQDLIP